MRIKFCPELFLRAFETRLMQMHVLIEASPLHMQQSQNRVVITLLQIPGMSRIRMNCMQWKLSKRRVMAHPHFIFIPF